MLVLAPRARRDLVEILQYTARTWGDAQVSAYRRKLEGAFETIRRNPDAGHLHIDLPDHLRVYRVGSHVIVYQTQGAGADEVAVVRVLHQRMSASRHV